MSERAISEAEAVLNDADRARLATVDTAASKRHP